MFLGTVRTVQAVLAPTELRALLPDIVALAVLFLTLGALAVAPFHQLTTQWIEEGALVALHGRLLCLLNRMGLIRMVGTVTAAALRPAHPSRGKTLAVHL